MEKELERLMNDISPSEAEEFISSFESFGESDISADEQERILSSVMRKAGFEMKKKINVNRAKKNTKRLIMLVAAAVVMSVGAVGAGAYYKGYRLEDGQIIRKFGGESAEEWLDSQGLNEIQTEQNGHFDISMYAFMSDGNYCQTIWCVEALDDAAKKQIDDDTFPVYIQAYYADTGEKIRMAGSQATSYDSINDESHYYFSHNMELKDVDISRDIEFHIIPGEVYMHDTENLADGLIFTVNTSPNIETKTLANENGTELLLSSIGASQFFKELDVYYTMIMASKLELIKKDGSTVEIENRWGCGIDVEDPDDYSGEFPIVRHIYFEDIIDISDVVGIRITEVSGAEDVYIDVNK